MLYIENLEKKYKQKKVLREVTLSADTSLIIGLIGDNGSGKTTLLKLIAGFIKDYTGTIRKESSCVSSIEYPTFFENLTVAENLLVLSQLQNKKSGIEEILQEVSLWEQRDKKFKDLSLGMKQKLAVARMLLSDSQIFLLDEPFNGLDVHAKKMLKELILSLKKKNKLIIVSSHILEELGEISDIVWFLKDGKVKNIIDLDSRYRIYKVKIQHVDIEKLKDFDYRIIKQSEAYTTIQIQIVKQDVVGVLKELLAHNVDVIEYVDITNKLENYMLEE